MKTENQETKTQKYIKKKTKQRNKRNRFYLQSRCNEVMSTLRGWLTKQGVRRTLWVCVCVGERGSLEMGNALFQIFFIIIYFVEVRLGEWGIQILKFELRGYVKENWTLCFGFLFGIGPKNSTKIYNSLNLVCLNFGLDLLKANFHFLSIFSNFYTSSPIVFLLSISWLLHLD